MPDAKKLVVVTPTYNERENIGMLIEKIFAPGVSNLEMFVVDDNSPDGTASVVRELAAKYPVQLIERTNKMGLGTAYIEAFKHILQDLEVGHIIQMDADLSHDPAIIPKLLVAARDADLILGSRYVAGGKIENWGVARRVISRAGCLYARIVLGLPYRDLTGGYKCWRREALERVPLDSLSSVGYNFQIETTWHAHKLGFRICEIPIVFTERKTGKSKLNFGIVLESFIKVLRLRFHG